MGDVETSLSAARELFAERGYAAVSLGDIADRAGIARMALEQRFPAGKEQLLQAVVVQMGAETAAAVRSAARRQEDPLAALIAGIDAFLDASMSVEVQRILLLEGPAVLGWDLWRAIESEQGMELVEDAIRQAVEAGELAPHPVNAIARVLLDGLQEASGELGRAEDLAVARAEAGARMRTLLDGMRSMQGAR